MGVGRAGGAQASPVPQLDWIQCWSWPLRRKKQTWPDYRHCKTQTMLYCFFLVQRYEVWVKGNTKAIHGKVRRTAVNDSQASMLVFESDSTNQITSQLSHSI